MSRLVLLTGSTGFVGRQLLRHLEDKGFSVRLVVRTGSSNDLFGKPCIESVIRSNNMFLEDEDWWKAACHGVDTVLHAAWYAEPGVYLQSPLNMVCLQGTLRLASGAVLAGVRRFVGLGTCFEYDLAEGVLSIETPLRPLTTYAGAKAAVFMALQPSLVQQGVEFAWCRLFYLFGEGEDERRLVPFLRSMLSSGRYAELTSGDQIRDFLDVKEAAQMIVKVTIGNFQGAVNICSGKPVTVRELAEEIADEYGRRDLLKFGARKDNLTDPKCVLGIPNLDLLG